MPNLNARLLRRIGNDWAVSQVKPDSTYLSLIPGALYLLEMGDVCVSGAGLGLWS